jgi:hypothetical protein
MKLSHAYVHILSLRSKKSAIVDRWSNQDLKMSVGRYKFRTQFFVFGVQQVILSWKAQYVTFVNKILKYHYI